MLKRIFADNYKCLVNFELQPDRVNLLLGENGGGKSCIFEVLEAIQDIVVLGDDAQDTLPTSTLTRWDTRDVQRFELEIEHGGGIYIYTLEVEHERAKESAKIKLEHVTFNGEPLYRYEDKRAHLFSDKSKGPTTFPTDPRRSFLAMIEERPEVHSLSDFRAFIAGMWILRFNPWLMAALSKKEMLWLERDGSNVASWYRRIAFEDREADDALMNDMRETLPGLTHFGAVTSLGSAKEIGAAFSLGPGRSYKLSLDDLSPGQRALFAIYAVTRFAKNASLLCFDEPDNFVALREIQPWLVKLRDAVEERGTQLLMISHHPEVIDYLASGTAFKIGRPTEAAARARPLSINLDLGLKASEVIARGWEDE